MGSENNIKVIIVKDSNEGGQKAFEIVKKELEKGLKVIGLATGSTPKTLYKNMRESDLDFSDVVAINLDEYIGLDPNHPQSYHYFMNEHLFNHKPFKETHIPDGLAEEEAETRRYDEVLIQNPIDLQILGIGVNGHIGFNEPGTPFNSLTSKFKLTEETIQSNKRFFDSEEEVPGYAYSMGLASIMSADKIVLIAYGEGKAQAIADTINGPITEEVPASILQRHENCIVILDEEAASLLDK